MQRFHVGDAVRARVMNPAGHTRLPAYLRGKPGTVESVHGLFPLADERARGVEDASRQALYTVAFRAEEVWGADAGEAFAIHADLWDGYLEPEISR
ncbi:MAG TPA: SH3-like domain-containing protein [Candidatus Dormibacteraeota bacterium]|nr:SH3-like domain-containing protein [Candidatus Dormibacteraeota bacterium]